MKKLKIILPAMILVIPAFAQASFFGTMAGVAIGGVAAHEASRYIDHRQGYESAQGAISAGSGLPNPRMTPGAVNPGVTQENIGQTICVRGYTRTIRPDESYTEKLKREQISQYGYADTNMRNYEEDHLVSLELGGAPDDPKNLWPQPHYVSNGWGSIAKDKLENRMRELVCSRQIGLQQAQHEIATNWINAYQKYIGSTP
jgi:hypothetical protein